MKITDYKYRETIARVVKSLAYITPFQANYLTFEGIRVVLRCDGVSEDDIEQVLRDVVDESSY